MLLYYGLYIMYHVMLQCSHYAPYVRFTRTRKLAIYRFRVSFSLGPAEGASVPSSIADIGGLVAKGEGTAAAKLGFRSADTPSAGLANPAGDDALGTRGEDTDGPPLTLGVSGGGAVPELNSAQRGHLRLVSERRCVRCAAMLGSILSDTHSYAPFVRSVRSVAGGYS